VTSAIVGTIGICIRVDIVSEYKYEDLERAVKCTEDEGRGELTLRSGPTDRIKMSSVIFWNGCLRSVGR